MQRYFVNEKNKDIFTLSESDFHHVISVMRMNIGDLVEIVYDNNLYLASIYSLSPKVLCKMVKKEDSLFSQIPKIVIAQGLVKEQKMDYILQKGTELGVFQIIPLSLERSIVKVSENDNKKLIRWERIVKEASEQSKRVDIPLINNVTSLKELTRMDFTHKYICSVNEKSKTIKSVLSNATVHDKIIFVIGPEGGLSKTEEDYLIDNGFECISFGNRVLRSETASLFILSAVNYEFLR